MKKILCFTFLLNFVACTSLNRNPSNLVVDEAITPVQKWLRSQPNARPGHMLRYLKTGQESLEAKINLIKSAKRTIYLSTFYINNDETAVLFKDLLCEKAKTVDVRIMLNGIQENRSDKDSGLYKPQSEPLGPKFEDKKSCPVKIVYADPNWPHNMHQKVLVVDGMSYIIGGTNIADYYYTYNMGDKSKWYDADIEIKGPTACFFHDRFINLFVQSVANIANSDFRNGPNYGEKWKDWHWFEDYSDISTDDGKSWSNSVKAIFNNTAKFKEDFKRGNSYSLESWFREWDEKYQLTKFKSCNYVPAYGGSAWVAPIVFSAQYQYEQSENPMIKAYDELIRASENSVKIWSPYFVPWNRIIDALQFKTLGFEYDFSQIPKSEIPGFEKKEIKRIIAERQKPTKFTFDVIHNSIKSTDEKGSAAYQQGCMYKRSYPLALSGQATFNEWQLNINMHRKGGVFDDSVAVFGSDNFFTLTSKFGAESLIVTDDPVVVKQTSDEYARLKADRKITTPLHSEAEFERLYDQVDIGFTRSVSEFLCKFSD